MELDQCMAICGDIGDAQFDSIVVVSTSADKLTDPSLSAVKDAIVAYMKVSLHLSLR